MSEAAKEEPLEKLEVVVDTVELEELESFAVVEEVITTALLGAAPELALDETGSDLVEAILLTLENEPVET